MASIDELLAQAQTRLRAGRLSDAEASYREIIAIDALHAQAHHELGIALAHQGNLDQALASLETAHGLKPEAADIAANLRLARAIQSNSRGMALAEQGQFESAADCHARALELKPDYAEAHYELGCVRLNQGRFAEAVASFERSLALKPDFAEAHNCLGIALAQQGKIDEALAHHRQALQQFPDYADGYYNMAVLLARQERVQEAIDAYRRAVALRPDHAAAHNNLAILLAKQNQLQAAVAGYERAIKIKPDYVEAHTNLGAALAQQNKLDEAVAAHRRAIELRSDYPEAHYNLGIALMIQDEAEQAERSFRRAIELRPHHAEAYYNLAYALAAQNELEPSAAACRRAIELKPDYAEAHVSHAVALLLLGDWDRGWAEYPWKSRQRKYQPPNWPQPQWSGEPLEGKTILLQADLGVGDVLQFIRFAPLVAQRGGRVVVECRPSVAGLIAGCAGIERVVSAGEPVGDFDVYALLSMLPAIFKPTAETIPAEIPYVSPDARLVESWRSELANDPLAAEARVKIGIAWQGNPDNPHDRRRSLPLSCFEAIARTSGVRLYSLQFGVGREQLAQLAGDWPIVDLADRLGDFHNTAAIVRNLDLVITCDSAPAHLAGALGVPVWVALPFAPDWRWMLDRSDSPWYPTMRLFRQTRRGDWRGVFQDIEEQLAQLVAAKGKTHGTSEPPSAAEHTDRGMALAAAGRLDEAEVCFRRAIESRGDHAPAHGNLGNLLMKQGKLDEAARSYQRVLELQPGSAEALYSLGLVAREQGRFEDAAAWCGKAIALDAGFADAHYTLAAALVQQNKLDEAAQGFRRTVELKPDFVGAHLGVAFTSLARGRYAEGWPQYEWRLKNQRADAQIEHKPRWSGSTLAGKTIVVCCEQGFGDNLQFVRYVSRLKEQGATVFVQCRPPLARLLSTSPAIDGVVPTGERLPPFVFNVPLLSLPGILDPDLANLPAEVPYLWPDKRIVESWRTKLADKSGLRIGIAWQGDPTQPMDRFRSIPLAHFEGIVRTPGVRVFSLQTSPGREHLASFADWPIEDLGDRLGDFHNTGAIARNLDLVITCDSAPAHLAGALGVPVWLALPFAADWRWMLDRSDTPWYPTMRLFRQVSPGDWPGVFSAIERQLARLVKRESNLDQPPFLD